MWKWRRSIGAWIQWEAWPYWHILLIRNIRMSRCFISLCYAVPVHICLSQCNFTQAVPGSRALLMVGFIQHASARFIGLHEAPDGHAYQLFLNNVFPEIVARPTKAQDTVAGTDFSCMDPFLPTTNLVILPGFVGMCMLASCSLYDLHEHHPAPYWCQVSRHNTMPLRAFSHQRYSLQVGCLLSLSWCQSHGLWVFLPMWFNNL